jgi:sugar transferase (PEP-CTERM/EpsH1 system associated)
MPRSKILFLTQRLPFPPDKGDKIRSFHQIEYLSARHDVYCACFIDNECDVPHVEMIRRWCRDVIAVPWNKRTALPRAALAWSRGRSLISAAFDHPSMRVALDDWCELNSFDIVTAYSSSMASYALRVPAGRRVLDLCDVDSQKWLDYADRSRGPLRSIYRSEGCRLREFERSCLDRFDATLVISEREREVLDPSVADPRIHVVPNGVNLPDGFIRSASANAPIVGFVGAMNYRPNVDAVKWFARKAWPVIHDELPFARFMIVGRDPVRSVRRLASIKGVEVIGEVASVRPFLDFARVIVAPLRIARGLQNKVLEAMAMARPVVATSPVADCMSVEPGREIIVADEPEDFAIRVLELLDDDSLCNRVAAAGQKRVQRDYSWSRHLNEYERILLGQKTIEISRPAQPVAKPAPSILPKRTFNSPLVSGSIGTLRTGTTCRTVR